MMWRRAAAAMLPAVLLTLAPVATAETPASGSSASMPAMLVADSVRLGEDGRLIAEGNVEVLHGGSRLTASRIVYEPDGERLTVEGPLTLTRGDDTVLLADSAELGPDLTDGLLRSARVVLDRQIQIAAAEVRRVGGRYTGMDKVVASACEVCSESEVPLWQIRASRIVHDEAERQLYFDHARLEVLGLPVFYVPQLRVPDPTVERATGFLTPKLRVNNQLGIGFMIPYFVALGPHQDVTLTPYLATGWTRTLEFRYRRAFVAGDLTLDGAVSQDSILDGETRAYLFGEGAFDLPRDFALAFDIESVSDNAYLLDYDFSEKDRLDSGVTLNRARRDELVSADLAYYETLRVTESNSTEPSLIGNLIYRQLFRPPGLGGTAGLTLSSDSAHRNSSKPTDGPDFDPYGDGIDVARLTAGLDWRGDWLLENGMVLASLGALDIDLYNVGDDANLRGQDTRISPALAAEWRWPMVAAGGDGATLVLEPVAQLAWRRSDDADIPNEDSVQVELDEANLLSLSRFPGEDAREEGLWASLGLGWTRYDPAGWSLGLNLGRIWRAEDREQFSEGSGLDGTRSDWLASVDVELARQLSLSTRVLFDDDLDVTKNDLRLDWFADRLSVGTSFTWVNANPAETRPDDLSEWRLDAAYRFRDNWIGLANWRFDGAAEEPTRAGVGLGYRNECVTVDLSLSRRFTSSTNVTPSTDLGFMVSLAGFGSRGGGGPARRCARF